MFAAARPTGQKSQIRGAKRKRCPQKAPSPAVPMHALVPLFPAALFAGGGHLRIFSVFFVSFLFHTLISLSKCHKNMPPEVVGRQYHIFYSAVCAESEALSDSEEAEPAPLSASVSAAALVSDPEEEDCSELIVSSSFARPSLNAFS